MLLGYGFFYATASFMCHRAYDNSSLQKELGIFGRFYSLIYRVMNAIEDFGGILRENGKGHSIL
ncbi:hypothetical protein KEJ19_05655 [Candidatus Bathyarchaeota archaeon]|nr:hypothetical protein [Candidatus Bathyarchaeota archaeon]